MAISITVLSFVFGVLFNTLIKDLILKTCTRVIWLENGLVKEDGKSNEIIEKYFI
jgi:ABC-type polysaccharide/polyol phosphate transport system ATPase subunit